MCGRFTLTPEIDPETLASLFQAERVLQVVRRRFNVAPTQPAPAVLLHQSRRVLTSLRWGLVPWWSKTPRQHINARSETIATAASFRESFERRRCLIPADGFFEWAVSGSEKQPYWFHRPDGAIFALAGLYDRWQTPKKSWQDTFTIITTRPNRLVAQVHDRMPVILAADAYDRWLAPGTAAAELERLLQPAPEDELEATAVSTLVNNPANDTEDCIQEAAPGRRLRP